MSKCCRPVEDVVPSVFGNCMTPELAIAWLHKKVLELEERVKALEEKSSESA